MCPKFFLFQFLKSEHCPQLYLQMFCFLVGLTLNFYHEQIAEYKQDIDEKSDIITAHELQLNEGPYTEGSKDLDSSELKAENERLTEELKVLKGECESNSKAKAGGGKRTLKKNFKRDRNKRTLRR